MPTTKYIKRRADEMRDVVNGIRMACRYAAFCGMATKFGFQEALVAYAKKCSDNINDFKLARKVMEGMAFYKHLVTIAKENGYSDPFHTQVVSFYWTGTPVLKGEIHNLATLWQIVRLPIKMIETDMLNKDWVLPAKVSGMGRDTVSVFSPRIAKRAGRLTISKRWGTTRKSKLLENLLFDKQTPPEDFFFTFHDDLPIEIIDEKTYQILKEASIEAVRRFNRAQKARG